MFTLITTLVAFGAGFASAYSFFHIKEEEVNTLFNTNVKLATTNAKLEKELDEVNTYASDLESIAL